MDSERDALFEGIDPAALARFKRFHEANPRVYQQFRARACEMRKAGHRRYSANALISRVRYEIDLVTNGRPFKINNDFASLYARLLMWHEWAAFGSFFERRTMKTRRKGLVDGPHRAGDRRTAPRNGKRFI